MSHLRSNNKEHDIFKTPSWFLQARHSIYYILGIIEVLLAFRFISSSLVPISKIDSYYFYIQLQEFLLHLFPGFSILPYPPDFQQNPFLSPAP